MKQVIVAHNGARDKYQLAIAFYKRRLLNKLVTDFYLPSNSLLFRDSIRRSEIPFSKIHLSIPSFAQTLKGLVGLKNNFKISDNSISRQAYNLSKSSNSSLFLYSHYANFAFSQIDRCNLDISKYLFQLHPHPATIKRLLVEEISRYPQSKDSILFESEFSYDDEYIHGLDSESRMANHIFVASTFTKNSLIENGIHSNKITVVPYGIESKNIEVSNIDKTHNNSILKLIFIGSFIQRKGIYDLLTAIKLLNSKFIQLTIIGRNFTNLKLSDFSCNSNIIMKTNVSNSLLNTEMQNSDLLVLPSIAEGFGHVILEAMSNGLPVLTTFNTAGSDIIDNGLDGFVVPIRQPSAIADIINNLFCNKEQLSLIKKNALLKSKKFTWDSFHSKITNKYIELEGRKS